MKFLSALALVIALFTTMSEPAHAWRPGWGNPGRPGPGWGHPGRPPHHPGHPGHGQVQCSGFQRHGLSQAGVVWQIALKGSGMDSYTCMSQCQQWIQWNGNWNTQYVCQRHVNGSCDVANAPMQYIRSCDGCEAALCNK